jgi:pimeloyl-ACP methyl ester carboxylesterase
MADDLKDLLDHLEISKPVTLVGHSMGGRTAMKFTSQNPKRVKALIVEDMHAKKVYKGPDDPGYFSSLMESVKRGRKTDPEGFYNFMLKREGFFSTERLEEAIKEFVPDRLERKAIMERHVVQGDDGTYRLSNTVEEISAHALYYRGGLVEDLTDDIKKIKVPTLFLAASDKSKVLFGKGAEHIAQNLPDAKIVKVPKSTHGIHDSNPDQFISEIMKFQRESKLDKPMRTIPAEVGVLKMDPPRPLEVTEMNYVDTGPGKWGTIVVIHDINKSAAENAKKIAALKKQGYRVIAPDLRGHGNTLSQGNIYSPRVLAQDVRTLVDELGVGKFSTISMGDGHKVAQELKEIMRDRLQVAIYRDKVTAVNDVMPDPRRIQKVLEEMPQVYNSSEELLVQLKRHFSERSAKKIQEALEIKKPNGDIVVNRSVPVRWFVEHDFNRHKRLRSVAGVELNEVRLAPGASLKEITKAVDKSVPSAKGARSWLRFLSP